LIGFASSILTGVLGLSLTLQHEEIGLRGDLAFLTILFTIANFLLLVPVKYRSSYGETVLRKLQKKHKIEREIKVDGSNLMLSLAVFGMGILYESRFRYIFALLDVGNDKRGRFSRMDAELGVKQIEYEDEEAERKKKTGY